MSYHGKSAMGDGPLAKTLSPTPTNLKMMSGMHPDGDFAWKINYGRGPMPGWKDILHEDDVWNVVNYIQSLSKNIVLTQNGTSDSHDDNHGH